MAKIKLTRRTFSATVAKTMDNAEVFEGIFTKALMGKTIKEYLSEQPDNQTLWVDTDKVVCVTDITEEATTHDNVFGIMFQFQPKISDIVWIDGKDYFAIMKEYGEIPVTIMQAALIATADMILERNPKENYALKMILKPYKKKE